jgi:hypothetical protein
MPIHSDIVKAFRELITVTPVRCDVAAGQQIGLCGNKCTGADTGETLRSLGKRLNGTDEVGVRGRTRCFDATRNKECVDYLWSVRHRARRKCHSRAIAFDGAASDGE